MPHDNVDDVLSSPKRYPTTQARREAILRILRVTGCIVMSLGALLLLLIGCAEEIEGAGRHVSVECSIQAVAPSPVGHGAFPDSYSALIAAVPAVSPVGLLSEALTPHGVVADCLWAACPFSPRAPPHVRPF